jgi:hypothetical protein
MVASAGVYVGIIGRRYGSLVPGRVNQSFTELEFETANFLGIPRLIFIVNDDDRSRGAEQTAVQRQLQDAFRNRLREITCASPTTPAELEIDLYQALVELSAAMQVATRRRRMLRGHTDDRRRGS